MRLGNVPTTACKGRANNPMFIMNGILVFIYGTVAPMVERSPEEAGVGGSNPPRPT